jgi:hypothetical protein
MALNIFNLSVDVKDATDCYMPEDLSINDQESFIEIVVEKWLGYENALSEHDEPDQESGGTIDFQKVTYTNTSQQIYIKQEALNLSCENDYRQHSFIYKPNFIQIPFLDIVSPPPKA